MPSDRNSLPCLRVRSREAQIAGRLRDKCLAEVLFFGFSAVLGDMYFNISAVRMNLRCLGTEAMASSKYQLSPREEAASLSVLAHSVWPLVRKQASSIISKKEEGIRE